MQFSTIVASLSVAATALAQSASAPASGAPATPSGSVMVQVVKVGSNNGSLSFEPNDIQAPPGSMVQFQFYPKNHSVAQSTFDQPCVPMSQSMPNAKNELWSGFMPTEANAQMMATWTIMINDTTPIWLYCAQAKHCQGGMVAGINAKSTGPKTVAAFKDLASKAPANVAPMGGAGPVGSPSATNSTGSAAPPSGGSSSGSSSSSGGSSTGGSPAAASSAAGNVKAVGAASSVSFTSSTMALAGLLSVFVTYAL